MQLFFSIRYGKIYLKTAKSYLEKGSDYAKKEIQRLERILEKVIVYLQIKTLKVSLNAWNK